MMKRCPNCSATIKDELEICPFCGYIEGTDLYDDRNAEKRIVVLTPEKKERRETVFDRFPLWVKILVPSVVAVVITIMVLINTGVIDLNNIFAKNTSTDETDLTEETEPSEVNVGVAVLNYGEHYYACFFGCESWEDARDQCVSKGGYLAVVSSAEENEVLSAFAKYYGYDNVYIGYSDSEEEGNWQWVTDEYNTFTNWNSGEPNGFTPDEDYAVMFDDGYWNDAEYVPRDPNGIISFICEWDIPVTGAININYDELMAALDAIDSPVVEIIADGEYYGTLGGFTEDASYALMYLAPKSFVTSDEAASLAEGDVISVNNSVLTVTGVALDSQIDFVDENGYPISAFPQRDGNYYLYGEGIYPIVSGEWITYRVPVSETASFNDDYYYDVNSDEYFMFINNRETTGNSIIDSFCWFYNVIYQNGELSSNGYYSFSEEVSVSVSSNEATSIVLLHN